MFRVISVLAIWRLTRRLKAYFACRMGVSIKSQGRHAGRPTWSARLRRNYCGGSEVSGDYILSRVKGLLERMHGSWSHEGSHTRMALPRSLQWFLIKARFERQTMAECDLGAHQEEAFLHVQFARVSPNFSDLGVRVRAVLSRRAYEDRPALYRHC